ncbi:hypothetical protein BRARA_D02374 [Brassica rapa]|uniref:PORR domain-containing protein n=1 Tax=Brassica campestris TaxID=3711 RepID=A0A397ZWK6_BRACM|nr:hypothetical protein BRARA_D02374 [Brassica rapa]
MLFISRRAQTLKTLPSSSTQIRTYVDVYMKWKKDQYFDNIEHILRSPQLKSVIALKNCITSDPNSCIPISSVSKKTHQFDLSTKVTKFLRQFPSVFEEFVGPEHNLPWFRLTPEAAELDREERRVYQDSAEDLRGRLRKVILMSRDNVLPLSIVQGMKWYLGLPDDYMMSLDSSFRFVDMEDGVKGLAVECSNGEKVVSLLQKNAIKNRGLLCSENRGLLCSENRGLLCSEIEFPLFPSKGCRLRVKIEDWLKEFQRLPYVSPYDDYSRLDPSSDVAEKRVVGFLHELLCLFVDHSAERKKLLCLKKWFGLPQKVHKAFERHPQIFYLSMKNKTCTAILREPYRDKASVEPHPVLAVRKKYIQLMKSSELILKSRRSRCRFSNDGVVEKDLDLDS